MKGAIGLGLLVGIVGSIFLPHVFALINGDMFVTFQDLLSALGTPSGWTSGLSGLFSAGFPEPFDGAFVQEILPGVQVAVFNPDILGFFSINPSTLMPNNVFLFFLPAMLSWLVCGLLSGLFSQSIKKGILAAAVFVIVEVLVYMLLKVIANKDLITEVILKGGSVLPFLGGVIITPVGFSILGGLIGGVISRFAFGPEEI
ncbi:MAG: hypothetical protein JW839_03765 [Candidatus Lokiarchaeota archaeon]|nr:hypothetical protein [Candidatus Lokiarchaeota archaeon]